MDKKNLSGNLTEEKIGWLIDYRRAVILDLYVMYWDISVIREGLKEYAINKEVQKIDKYLLENLKEILKVNPDIQDDDTQPLEKWWWHLHKIAKGKYPKDKFPDYLKEHYKNR